jgi:hypothetical protein
VEAGWSLASKVTAYCDYLRGAAVSTPGIAALTSWWSYLKWRFDL